MSCGHVGRNFCRSGRNSKLCAIIGSQWGDEGKGKLVDILADKFDVCARFNGGNNAGHTVIANGKKYPFHLVPCGILYPSVKNVLGNGVVIHLPSLFDELKTLDKDNLNYDGRMLISDRAHLTVQVQMEADAKAESDPKKQQIGTTKKGIGPTYQSKAGRFGLRVGDLQNWNEFVNKYNYLQKIYKEKENLKVDTEKELKLLKELRDRVIKGNMIIDTVSFMHECIRDGKKILAEGANACMLDLDFGTYPYVTSSSTNIGGVCTGLGIPPTKIQTVIGIVKAYTTRVGEGPFPTEQKNQIGEYLQKTGFEFGVTTGRKRRCGWIDLPVVRYANMINSYSSINITKLDVFDGLDEIKIGVNYRLNGKTINYMPSTLDEYSKVEVEYMTMPGWKKSIAGITNFSELPQQAQDYIMKLEELLQIPIKWIGTGPERESIILKK